MINERDSQRKTSKQTYTCNTHVIKSFFEYLRFMNTYISYGTRFYIFNVIWSSNIYHVQMLCGYFVIMELEDSERQTPISCTRILQRS